MAKSNKMTIRDASRIYSATALKGDGKIAKDSFAARAMSVATRQTPTSKPSANKPAPKKP